MEDLSPTNCAIFPGHLLVLRPSYKRARGSADSVCIRARRYLYHVLTRPYTRPPTHTIPLHVTTLPTTPVQIAPVTRVDNPAHDIMGAMVPGEFSYASLRNLYSST